MCFTEVKTDRFAFASYIIHFFRHLARVHDMIITKQKWKKYSKYDQCKYTS